MLDDLEAWLAANDLIEGASKTAISGGSINNAFLIESRHGERIFLKWRDDVPANFFESEAEGLQYLDRVGSVSVPRVLGYGQSFIALDYLSPGKHQPDFWEILGYQLAHMHEVVREQHGFVNDNFCGTSHQINQLHTDGYQFFAEHRLMYQAKHAQHNNLLSQKDFDKVQKLCEKLEQWIPFQPASLLHGDLWSGNIHTSPKGEPVFIDPSVYFSWGEIDIAMTKLFGGFPDRFYDAYSEVTPLEHGWQERLSLYNLYPLLNHLNMFGRGYLDSVKSILDRFV